MKLGLSVLAAVAKSMRKLRDKSKVAETLSMTCPVSKQGKYIEELEKDVAILKKDSHPKRELKCKCKCQK